MYYRFLEPCVFSTHAPPVYSASQADWHSWTGHDARSPHYARAATPPEGDAAEPGTRPFPKAPTKVTRIPGCQFCGVVAELGHGTVGFALGC